MKFTEVSSKDIPTVQRLARESWESAYAGILAKDQIDYMLSTMYSTEELTAHFSNPNYHYFFIQKGNDTMGFIGYELNYEEDTAKLHRIYLLPEAKGKGYGKAALIFLKHHVHENGNCRIILNVNKNNPAKNVYESQGFRVYDEGKFDIGNGYVMDDYLMEIDL